MAPGVLWVSSRISQPTPPPSSPLTPQKFCAWYENQHIQEVLALPGVPSAVRYEAMTPQPSPTAWSASAPWLTVYEMPDINYRQTAEFKGLDGQSEPKQELLDGVFKQARFDTRFYECVQTFESEGCKEGPGELLISAALQPAKGEEADFDRWYKEEHLSMLAECKGYRRSRRFELVEASTLERFERRVPECPVYLSLHEFDGVNGGLDWEGLQRSVETEWTKKVMGGCEMEEVGWYRRKRVYIEEKK